MNLSVCILSTKESNSSWFHVGLQRSDFDLTYSKDIQEGEMLTVNKWTNIFEKLREKKKKKVITHFQQHPTSIYHKVYGWRVRWDPSMWTILTLPIHTVYILIGYCACVRNQSHPNKSRYIFDFYFPFWTVYFPVLSIIVSFVIFA